MKIRVEVKNDILGNYVFWEGEASSVQEVRNIPARTIATMVAQDGIPRVFGMWHASAVA